MNKPQKPPAPREEPPDEGEPYELPPPPSKPDPLEPPSPQQDPPPEGPERDSAWSQQGVPNENSQSSIEQPTCSFVLKMKCE
jgi:hypothetical protein